MSRFGISHLSVRLALAIVSVGLVALSLLAFDMLPLSEWMHDHPSIALYGLVALGVLGSVAAAVVCFWLKGLLSPRLPQSPRETFPSE